MRYGNYYNKKESPEHKDAKKRIRNLARAKGNIAENEVRFYCWSEYHTRVTCYSADIFIYANGGTTPIIVEIDGYKGHSSRYQCGRDERRTEDIQALWGDNIVVRRYTIEDVEKRIKEVKKELGI